VGFAVIEHCTDLPINLCAILLYSLYSLHLFLSYYFIQMNQFKIQLHGCYISNYSAKLSFVNWKEITEFQPKHLAIVYVS
jgi:hypothetical protein